MFRERYLLSVVVIELKESVLEILGPMNSATPRPINKHTVHSEITTRS